jgi:putative transposase
LDKSPLLSQLSEANRELALRRFSVIQPFLEEGVALTEAIRGHNLSLRTARYWISRYRKEGLPGLVQKHPIRAPRLSPRLRALVEGLALRRPRPSIAAIYRKVIVIAKELGEKPPAYITIYRLVSKLDPALVTMAHAGSKAYSETYDLVHRQEAAGPNAVWQADHTQLDILVLDGKRKPCKPWLTIVLDDYSRAIAGYSLSLSAPSTFQTALALRQAIWRKAQPHWQVCGIPEVLYTDHGTDFTSKHLEQVTADLKIRLIFSNIGRPRGRGKIERFFGSLAQVFLCDLPGYAPGSQKARPMLTLTQLGEELESYLLGRYMGTPHSTTGVAPQERWQAGGFLPNMPESLEQLDLLLLMVARTRTVHQDGIRFAGFRYLSPTLAAYVGEQVIIRYDPRDMGEVRIFYRDRFLCRAICQELAGDTVSLREITHARDARRQQLRQTLNERRRTVDSLLESRRWDRAPEGGASASTAEFTPTSEKNRLKRYVDE